MIGARLAPSLPPGPDLARTPRDSGGAPAPAFDGDRAPERADRPDRPTATHPDQAGRAQRGERTGRADRREDADGAGRDGDADAFERMVDRDGAHASGAQRAPAADAAPTDPRSTSPSSEDDDAPRDALPTQLLALLSTLAPATAPPNGVAAGAAGASAQSAGTGSALPTLAMPTPQTGPARSTGVDAALANPPSTTNAADVADAPATLLPQATETAAGTTDRTGATFDAPLRDAPDAAPFPLPSAAPAAAPRIAAAPLLTPVTLPADPQAGFDDGFGSRIVWMAEQRLGHADLRVTPDHLGTIDVRLQLDGAKVSAEFYSAQPEVRQALEASMGRLRDLLGQHGLQLAHADVGQQRPGQGDAAPREPALVSGDAEPATPAPVAVRSRRLLDEIA